MSDTNIASHPDMVHIGPARLGLYDEVNDRLVMIGKVDDLKFQKTITEESMTEIISGVEVETKSQPVSERYTLTGKLVQTLDPATQNLVMKNCGTPVVPAGVGSDCNIGTVTQEVQVFLGPQHIPGYNNGFYGTGALPAPAAVASSVLATGGSHVAGTYVFVVTAVYDGTEGDYVEAAPLAVLATDTVLLTITPPATAVPDSYRIYVYNSGTGETRVADADLIQDTDAVNLSYTSWTRGAAYPGDQTSSFEVRDEAGALYSVGVDYTIDASCAMFCVEEGGSIVDGEWIRITYTYWQNYQVNMSIGPSNVLPKYVHPVILSFHDDDRIIPVGRGFEMHLWKVTANSGWTWDLSALNFESGFEFTWKVLCSEKTRNHGHIYNFHRQFSMTQVKDFRTLTDWNAAASCDAAAS